MATSPSDIAIGPSAEYRAIRALFVEYAEAIGVDLSFQHFEEELEDLAGTYEVILLARVNGEPAGCVALRRIDATTCEMKRLFVRPPYQTLKFGRRLAEAIILEARGRAYSRMRLDTLPSMSRALGLYRSLGFREIEPYRFNPVAGTRFLELTL